jgi:hypothetical protein
MSLHTVVRVLEALAALAAAALWAVSAGLDVHNDIDTIVPELQRIGYWNGWAALCSCLAASLGVLDICITLIESARYFGPPRDSQSPSIRQ